MSQGCHALQLDSSERISVAIDLQIMNDSVQIAKVEQYADNNDIFISVCVCVWVGVCVCVYIYIYIFIYKYIYIYIYI